MCVYALTVTWDALYTISRLQSAQADLNRGPHTATAVALASRVKEQVVLQHRSVHIVHKKHGLGKRRRCAVVLVSSLAC